MNWICGLSLVLWAGVGSAQTRPLSLKLCGEINPTHCVQVVQEGEIVPFSGLLLTKEKALDQDQKASFCKEEISIKVRREQDIRKDKLRVEREVHAADRAGLVRQISLLEEYLRKVQNPVEAKWYDHPFVWVSLGVVSTAAAMYGSAQLLKVVAAD